VQNYGKRLFSFIRSRVKSQQDAEDILQDVWYQLSSIIDTQPIELLSSWLYRVSRNRIVDKKRKQKLQSLEDLAYYDNDGEMVFPEALLLDDQNPETEIERAIFIPAAIAAAVFIFGSAVMLLWNWILPVVLGVKMITFWQAIGILVLSKILFGGFRQHHCHHGYHGHYWSGKWMNLNTEEREKMRSEWRERCTPHLKQE